MSEFRMTVVGCDGSWPRPGGACSSYLLQTPTTSVLIDIGGGSLAHLQKLIAPQDLDAIVVSHQHPDHCADLAPLSVMFRHSVNGRSGLPVYAAPGVKEQIFPDHDVSYEFEWTNLEHGDELEVGDLCMRTSRTDHPVVTFALRVDCGDRTLSFTADTGTEWQLSSLGDDIDLALCEAVAPGEISEPQHMNSEQAARTARDAGAKRLMLTHVRPDFDPEQLRKEAEAIFDGEVLIAEPGRIYDV